MARVRFTNSARADMTDHGVTIPEVIDVIANFEEHESDPSGSGLIRVRRRISGRTIRAIYVARGDNLIVLAVSVEEVS